LLKSLKKIRRSLVVIAVLVAILCSIPCEAAAYYSYIYDNQSQAVAAPEAAQPVRTISSIKVKENGKTETIKFSMLQDLFIYNDKMYIVDSGNNRIIITDMDFENAKIIKEFKNKDEKGKKFTDTFNEPHGICVNDEAIFIADTKNARIIKLDHKLNLKLIIENPTDESFPKDFVFKPVRVSVDNYNRIFVVSSGYNMGLMQFTVDGDYLQSIGAPKVTMSIFQQIWRKFQTKAQRERSEEVVPTEYSNIFISPEGFLYVTSESTDTRIEALRMLNSKGTDIINRLGNPSGDIIVGQGSPTYTGASAIVDVAEVGSNGNVAILDRKRARVFVYNDECHLLYMFAGPGEYNGGMLSPSSMVYQDGKFYISDYSKNTISVFELTDYGEMFNQIADAKNDIDYKKEEELWSEILSQNANCTLALKGLGNAAYKRQDYKEAMHYYELAEDRTNYSKAYGFVRREWLETNITYALIVVAIFVVIMMILSKLKQKYVVDAPKDSFLGRMHFTSYVSFHPLNGFWVLKREKRGSYGVATIWLVATILTMIISNLFNGFIFNTNNLQTYNMLSNLAFISAAVILWTVAQWCVTSLMDGEGKLGDIYIATCYALRPYVVCNLIATVLSQVLLETEGDFYYVLTSLALLWVLMLLISSVMQTHDYSLGKTFIVLLIIIIVLLLIVFIGMLVMALLQQLTAFVTDIIKEVTLRV